jgi:hypothetical protein
MKICDLRGLIAGKAYHSLNWTNSAENNLPAFGKNLKKKNLLSCCLYCYRELNHIVKWKVIMD